MGSTLQFPPPTDSIELVTNLLSDFPPETPLEQSKLNRWKSDLIFLTSRHSVLETSQKNLKKKLKGLFIATVCLAIVVVLNLVYIIIGAVLK
jgi:hypothetical protein